MNQNHSYLHFEKPENAIKFEEEMNVITNKNAITMGIEEFLLQRAEKKGHKQGLEEGKTIFVTSLLQSTDFDSEKIASLADTTVAFVEKIRKSLSKKK